MLRTILTKANKSEINRKIQDSNNNFIITGNSQNNLEDNQININEYTKNPIVNNKKIINSKYFSPLKELLSTNIYIYQGKYKNIKKKKKSLELKKLTINNNNNTEENNQKKITPPKQQYCIPVMLNLNNKEKQYKKKLNMIPYNNNPKKSLYHSVNITKNNLNKIFIDNYNKKKFNEHEKLSTYNPTINNDYLDKIDLQRKILKDQMINRHTASHGKYGNYMNDKKKKNIFWEFSTEIKSNNNNRIIDKSIKDKIIGYDKIFFKFNDNKGEKKNDEDNENNIKNNGIIRNKDKILNFINMRFTDYNFSK